MATCSLGEKQKSESFSLHHLDDGGPKIDFERNFSSTRRLYNNECNIFCKINDITDRTGTNVDYLVNKT